MTEIDFECTHSLVDSGFDVEHTVALILGKNEIIYVNDPFLDTQELLDCVTTLLVEHGMIRLASIPQDIEGGSPPRLHILSHAVLAVRTLNVREVNL